MLHEFNTFYFPLSTPPKKLTKKVKVFLIKCECVCSFCDLFLPFLTFQVKELFDFLTKIFPTAQKLIFFKSTIVFPNFMNMEDKMLTRILVKPLVSFEDQFNHAQMTQVQKKYSWRNFIQLAQRIRESLTYLEVLQINCLFVLQQLFSRYFIITFF